MTTMASCPDVPRLRTLARAAAFGIISNYYDYRLREQVGFTHMHRKLHHFRAGDRQLDQHFRTASMQTVYGAIFTSRSV